MLIFIEIQRSGLKKHFKGIFDGCFIGVNLLPTLNGPNTLKNFNRLEKVLGRMQGGEEPYSVSCVIFEQLFWKCVISHCHESVKLRFC